MVLLLCPGPEDTQQTVPALRSRFRTSPMRPPVAAAWRPGRCTVFPNHLVFNALDIFSFSRRKYSAPTDDRAKKRLIVLFQALPGGHLYLVPRNLAQVQSWKGVSRRSTTRPDGTPPTASFTFSRA